jgi:hypothetical protein
MAEIPELYSNSALISANAGNGYPKTVNLFLKFRLLRIRVYEIKELPYFCINA